MAETPLWDLGNCDECGERGVPVRHVESASYNANLCAKCKPVARATPPKTPARLSTTARIKLDAALRRAVTEVRGAKILGRSMRHDDYQEAGETAIKASGLYGRAAAQASNEGVEIFEIVDGSPHVDFGAMVRWYEDEDG